MNPTVLIVEDNDNLRGLLTEALLHFGWKKSELIVCLNGESADAVLRNADLAARVDVVLCDFNLGPGLNGVDLFDRYAAKFSGRWILHTGNPEAAPRRPGIIVFSKPVDLERLASTLRTSASVGTPAKPVKCATCCCWFNDEDVCTEGRVCVDHQPVEGTAE